MTLRIEEHPDGYKAFVLPARDFDMLTKAARESSPKDGARMTLKVDVFDFGHVLSIGGVLFTWDHQPPSLS